MLDLKISRRNGCVDLYNLYAIAVLEQLGNDVPSQLEIDQVETLLRTVCRKFQRVAVIRHQRQR